MTPARERRRSRLTTAIGLAIVIAFLIWYIATGTSYYLFILNSVLLAVIGAASLNLLQGTVGQVSIGNVAFLVVGAFSSVWALRLGIPYPLDLVVALVAGALIGAVVGLPAIRIRGFYLAFATLAAHFIFVQLAQTYQSHAVGATGFIVPLRFASHSLVDQQRLWALVLAGIGAIVLLIIYFLTTFRLGRTWRVIRDHEIIAASLGIRVTRYKLVAFMVSSAFIALEGGLTAHLSGYVTSDAFTLSIAVSYVAMVLIGGHDSLLGSVVGATIVISLPYLTANVMGQLAINDQYSAQIAQILYGSLVVVFVVYSSGGVADWLRKGYAFVTSSRVATRGKLAPSSATE
jgi:branched-chain amino acid transport system permease protein